MIFDVILTMAAAALTVLCVLLARRQAEMDYRIRTAEAALNGMREVLTEVKKTEQELLGELGAVPADELQAQAEAEKIYARGLENLTNYSVDVAMGGGDDR